MINYDSPIISLIYMLGIDLTNLSLLEKPGDFVAVIIVTIFAIFILQLLFKYIYKVMSELFRGGL